MTPDLVEKVVYEKPESRFMDHITYQEGTVNTITLF